jgi:hypothetical protein
MRWELGYYGRIPDETQGMPDFGFIHAPDDTPIDVSPATSRSESDVNLLGRYLRTKPESRDRSRAAG